MSRKGNPELGPPLDPGLAELDRELRAIRFRERASFASELEHHRLRRPVVESALRRRRFVPAAAILAAVGLGLLQLSDGPQTREPQLRPPQPVLVGEGAPPEAALYLTVNEAGTILHVARLRSTNAVGYSQAAVACAFDIERALCGPPAIVATSGLALRVARGPFVYSDVCCSRSTRRSIGREGVLTVSGLRDAVVFVFLYDDVNVDGRLSAGDRLRVRMHPTGPSPPPLRYASRHDSSSADAGATRSTERRMSVVVY